VIKPVVHTSFFTLLFALVFGLAQQNSVEASEKFTDANSLMKHIDQMWRSNSSHAIMSMHVKTKRYSRSLTLETWSKGKEKSLIIIKKPKKDRGIATLKVNNNIWNYLPKINRVSKVPASMMGGSWMGSHFSNDDLVKENTFEDDYTSTISFEGTKNNQQVVEVTSIPTKNATVVWGKVVTRVEVENFTPISTLYYDEHDVLVREMRFDQVEKHGDRFVPMQMSLRPMNDVSKKDESTIVQYHSISFNPPIKENLFSIKRLRR